MSIEILLIPLAIAVTKQVADSISNYTENKRNEFKVIETRMKDEALLKQALEEWSCLLRQVESLDSLKLSNENEVTFLLNQEGCYSLVISTTADEQAFRVWVDNVEKSYTHYLQQRVYQNLIEKAKEQGLILEKEELLEDNSIQVTYILNEQQ